MSKPNLIATWPALAVDCPRPSVVARQEGSPLFVLVGHVRLISPEGLAHLVADRVCADRSGDRLAPLPELL